MTETVRKTPNGLHVTCDDGRNATRDLAIEEAVKPWSERSGE